LDDLANLPKIRTGALPKLEPEGAAKAKTSPIIGDGERNVGLIRLACALAHDVKTQAELLEKVREANATFCNPPLSDAEVQGRVRSAWRYKMNGTLMARGGSGSIILPTSALDHAMASGNFDVMGLVAMARKYHDKPGAVFALTPRALAKADKIRGWSRNRYRAVIRQACDLLLLEQVTAGGKGPRDPAKYRFAVPKLRGL
jgi:hypothetical protein